MCSVILLAVSGNVLAQDFEDDKDAFINKYLKQDRYELDTSAPAIVLYEKFTYDLMRSETMICKVKKIIRINKKSGIKYGDVDVAVYNARDFYAKISHISATVYNIEHGQVKEQDITSENIDKQMYDHRKEQKFSIPSVRESSIIEYSYQIERQFTYKIGTWQVQGTLPKLYTELEIKFPLTMEVISVDHNMPEFKFMNEKELDSHTPDAYVYAPILTDNHWVRKNVHPLYDEPFVADVDKYREQKELVIKGFYHNNGTPDEQFDTWDKVNDFLFRSPRFYKALTAGSSDVIDKAEELTSHVPDTLEKANKIFSYVRSTMTANHSDDIGIKTYPADVLNNKGGTPAEINMLLIKMLRAVDIEASPVILSTKQNGEITKVYPDISQFNYVVCQATIAGQVYYLDASGKYNSFNFLPSECYNGFAWMVGKKGKSVLLDPDQAKERSFFKLQTDNNDPANYTMSANFFFGQYASAEKRALWNGDSSQIKTYINDLIRNFPGEKKVKNFTIENLHDPDNLLKLSFTFTLDWPSDEQMIYLDPTFFRNFDKNPFTVSERKYNINLPYTINTTSYVQIRLPTGYSIGDSLAPYVMRFDNNAQYHNDRQYDKATNTITLNTNLRISKTTFSVAEYAGLKEFFDNMLAEEEKVIVLKKL
jgi:hypothetical protein